MLPSEIECCCPSGYPKRVRRDYGAEARDPAVIWHIPEPSFEVAAHTGVCRRLDEVVSLGSPTASVS